MRWFCPSSSLHGYLEIEIRNVPTQQASHEQDLSAQAEARQRARHFELAPHELYPAVMP